MHNNIQKPNHPASPKLCSKNFSVLYSAAGSKSPTPQSSKPRHADHKHEDIHLQSPHIKAPLRIAVPKSPTLSRELDRSEKKKLSDPSRKSPILKVKQQEPNQQSIYNYLMRQKSRLGLDNGRNVEKKIEISRSVSIASLRKEEIPVTSNVNKSRVEESEHAKGQERSTAATTDLSSRSTEDEEDPVLLLLKQKRLEKIRVESPMGNKDVAKNECNNSEEIRNRKKELLKIHEEMVKKSEQIGRLEEVVKEERKKERDNLKKIEENVERITEEVIRVVRKCKEDWITGVRERYRKIESTGESLEDYLEEVGGMKEDIELNFYKIAAIGDQRVYKSLVEEYRQKNEEFEELSERVREINEGMRLGCEEVEKYKRMLKNMLEARFGNEVEQVKSSVELELVGNPVLISFENREIFQSAIQLANQKASVGDLKLDLMSKVNGTGNVFKIDCGEQSEVAGCNVKSTPRLNFELKEESSEGTEEFQEGDAARDCASRRVKTDEDEVNFLKYLEPKGNWSAGMVRQGVLMCPPAMNKRKGLHV